MGAASLACFKLKKRSITACHTCAPLHAKIRNKETEQQEFLNNRKPIRDAKLPTPENPELMLPARREPGLFALILSRQEWARSLHGFEQKCLVYCRAGCECMKSK